MAITLLQVVDSPKFLSYINTTKLWRNQVHLFEVLTNVINNTASNHHDVSKKSCTIRGFFMKLSKKLKTPPFNKKSWALFRETCEMWLGSVEFEDDCCMAMGVQEEQEQQKEKEQEQEGQEGQDDVFFEEEGGEERNEESEPPSKVRKMVESRKARKSYSESGKRWKRNVLKEEMDRLEAMEDEKLLADIMVKLQKRSKRKS